MFNCDLGRSMPVSRITMSTNASQYRPPGAQGRRSAGTLFSKVSAWNSLRKHFKPQFAPPGLTFERFLNTLQGMTDHSAGRGKGDGTFTYKTLLVAGMHFMDVYNYDINRVKRCVIHYTAPNGLVYPFCTYNSGPCFREKIEKQYSVPLPKNTGNGDAVVNIS